MAAPKAAALPFGDAPESTLRNTRLSLAPLECPFDHTASRVSRVDVRLGYPALRASARRTRLRSHVLRSCLRGTRLPDRIVPQLSRDRSRAVSRSGLTGTRIDTYGWRGSPEALASYSLRMRASTHSGAHPVHRRYPKWRGNPRIDRTPTAGPASNDPTPCPDRQMQSAKRQSASWTNFRRSS